MTNDRGRPEDSELPETASLPREIAPPAALEDRVLAAFRAQAIAPSRRRLAWRQWMAAAALVAISLAAGIGIGRRAATTNAVASEQPRFMLMLWGNGAGDPDDRSAEQYRRWASAQRAEGRRVSGERLASDALIVDVARTTQTVAEVEGFFIVSAASLDDAAAIARSTPHVQNGGRIVVRPINTP
jgi:hypothetical protein